MAFTAKEELFIQEYMKCRNASEAARRAGYSKRSAGSIGHENLKKPEISDEIKRRTEALAMKTPELMARLADIARGSMEDFVSFNLAPYPDFILDLDKARERNKLHLIQELSYDKNGNPKVKLYSATDALKALAQLATNGPTGAKDDPIHSVNQTLDEWRAMQEQRRNAAAETMDDFDDSDEHGDE